MSLIGTPVPPCKVLETFGFSEEEVSIWNVVWGYFQNRLDRSRLIPDIFVCPGSNGPVAPGADNVVLCKVDGQLRFVFVDEVERVEIEEVWNIGRETVKWKDAIIAYCRDHIANRQALIEQANSGLTSRRISALPTTRSPAHVLR